MKKEIFWSLVVIITAIAGVWFLATQPLADSNTPAPTPEVPEGWLPTASGGGTFHYPATLGTSYVSTVDWPPILNVYAEDFTCTEAGEETERAGRTELVSTSGSEYCRTTLFEGAAGSTYGQYAYAFEHDGRTAILTFSIRFVQCMNYDDPQQAECLAERELFDLDVLVDRIAQTVVF